MQTLTKQSQVFMAKGLSLLGVAWVSLASAALADQVVYKCGQEITNTPLDPQLCQALRISGPTQIEGTKVQGGAPQASGRTAFNAFDATLTPSSQTTANQVMTSMGSQERQQQARTILEDELQKLNAQYAELVRLYNRGQPQLLIDESVHQPSYQQRVVALKAQIQRVERDMQSLQRELVRSGKRMADAVQTR